MKLSNFEENFSAWLDGKLSAEEIAVFESEMRNRGFDPEAERTAADKTRNVLRAHADAPKLSNPEFFSHQLLHRIEEDHATATASSAKVTPSRRSWFVPWMPWAGAAALLTAAGLFKVLIPVPQGAADRAPYFATVVDARSLMPTVSASTVYDPKDNVTVLWLDGLDYLPADYALQ